MKSLAKPLSFARAEKLGRRVDPGPCPHGAFQARPWERAGFSSVLTEANSSQLAWAEDFCLFLFIPPPEKPCKASPSWFCVLGLLQMSLCCLWVSGFGGKLWQPEGLTEPKQQLGTPLNWTMMGLGKPLSFQSTVVRGKSWAREGTCAREMGFLSGEQRGEVKMSSSRAEEDFL